MGGLYAAAAAVCASSIVAALLSRFITDGGTRKLLGLVTGAFVLCCMIVPLVNAVSGISADLSEIQGSTLPSEAVGDSFDRAVLSQARANLEGALRDILAQNGIAIDRAEVVLAVTDGNRVIISSVNIYAGADVIDDADRIRELTVAGFGITPQIITE